MTFTEWINTQEDICSKLREQGYEEVSGCFYGKPV